MVIIAGVPDDLNFIDLHETHSLVRVFQMQDPVFHLHNLTTQTRYAPAKDVYLLSDHSG